MASIHHATLLSYILIVTHSITVEIDYLTDKYITLAPRIAYLGRAPGSIRLSAFGVFFKYSRTVFINYCYWENYGLVKSTMETIYRSELIM